MKKKMKKSCDTVPLTLSEGIWSCAPVGLEFWWITGFKIKKDNFLVALRTLLFFPTAVIQKKWKKTSLVYVSSICQRYNKIENILSVPVISNCWGYWWTESEPGLVQTSFVFATVPDSSVNSWESWIIFNLRKNNINQYFESDSLIIGNCSMSREYMTLQDVKHIIITVHNWTAIFLKHLANTSFMASF